MPECRNMGLGGLGSPTTIFKRKFRWMLTIDGIVGEGIDLYPPSSAARPKLTFNDFQVNHLVETITIPGRPVWSPITITVYDILRGNNNGTSGGQNSAQAKRHPIYDWILSLYGQEPDFPYYPSGGRGSKFKKWAYISMYDGCGQELERWTLENVWPSEVDFGELDMGSSDVAMITMTLKYDRAFLEVF